MAALDRVFDLLSEERRRYALYYLANRESAVPVSELADAVADWEDEDRDERGDADGPWTNTDQIELTLQHNHLPRASEAEFIEYDADREVVRATDAPQEFEAIVAVARLIERPANGGRAGSGPDPDPGPGPG